nr:recombinase family protein [Paenibacillus phyllosphaerae]
MGKSLEAVVYIRNPNLLDNQLNVCADFVEVNDLETKRIFMDSSEDEQEWPQFNALKDYIETHPNTVVVTSSTGRISRDKTDMYNLLDFLKSNKCHLVCIEEKMDTTILWDEIIE